MGNNLKPINPRISLDRDDREHSIYDTSGLALNGPETTTFRELLPGLRHLCVYSCMCMSILWIVGTWPQGSSTDTHPVRVTVQECGNISLHNTRKQGDTTCTSTCMRCCQ